MSPLRTLLISALIFIVLTGTAFAGSDKSGEAGRDRIKKIESKLSLEREKLKAFDSREKDILAILSELEREVSDKKRVIGEIGERINRAKGDVRELSKRLAGLEQAQREVEGRLSLRLVALYKYARKGYFRVLSNAADLDEFWRRARYVTAVVQEDRRSLLRLAEERRSNEKEILQIRDQIKGKKAARDQEQSKLATLRRDLESKVINLVKIHKEKEFYETAVEELQLAARDLKQTLKKIEKRPSYRTLKTSRFADSRGKLPFPLQGKVIRGDKLAGSVRLGRQKGVFIEGPSDDGVRAVFKGRVDYSGRLKGYGEVVIINHGSRYFTISAHLSKRRINQGNMVQQGDIIGSAGVFGTSRTARLYFEIRKGDKHLNPMRWLRRR